MVYTIEDIAKLVGRNALVVRHWILWDEQNNYKYLPRPIKIIGIKKKTRLYDEDALKAFKKFSDLVIAENIMVDYNKKHFNYKK